MKNVEDIYSLSPLQRGMLFHSLLAPESGIYVNQFTCTLPADLDPGLFRQAWEKLVERHRALRTAFLWDGLDEPLQVVRQRFTLPWQDLDWRGLSAEEQARRFEELRHRDRHTPLSLGKVPLMRFSLVRLDREHGFVWTYHHLLLDGWSVPLLIQELMPVYAALQAGREPALPPVRPFSEYILWLQKQDLSRAEPFWRRELAGFTAPNPLGIDRPSTPEAHPDHDEHKIWVSREVTAGLQALAAQHKLTLQNVTLGAWAVLLQRYSGEEDVVFGGVVSGRPAVLPGVETMIGLFINTLPVRVRVGDGEPLIPWLQRLQAHQLVLHELEHTPLFQIQRWSEIPPGSTLFETLYVFENYPTPDDDGPDGATRERGSGGGLRVGNLRNFESTNYPVTLVLMGGDQIPLRLMFDRHRIEAVAVPRLLDHLATLLARMAENPERRLGELGLLREAERQELLHYGHEGSAPAPTAPPVHVRFAQAAARSPEAVAVVADEQRLTYGELDREANRLARRLRRLGVGPETRVAICLERSATLVSAILAVLKAGGAYVPLDPESPRDRMGFLLADSAARVLLTEERLLDRLPLRDGGGPQVLCLEAAREETAHESTEPLDQPVAEDQAAYVIYTSGSTGRPKGVVVSHAAVTRLLTATEGWFGFGPDDVWTLFHSYAFDFSVWEIWGALACGGRLVVVPWQVSRAPGAFLRLLARERVTVLNQTPSAFRQLVQAEEETAGGTADLSLRWVIFGGEALQLPDLAPWFRRHGDERPRLINMYGITETTVHVTYRRIRAADLETAPGSVIGVPIPDLRLYVLDRVLEPTPLLLAGELCVGGAGLARGYLGQPGLTAERFVPDPFCQVPGARLYRSGDLARRLPDGDLQYLGRIDHQVKIRGFRIEPGEIEAALKEHPQVRDAVVIASGGAEGHRQLIAYVAGDLATLPPTWELRDFLSGRLPAHMVPALFVPLAALPLTANGKVDRRALPAPDPARIDLREPYSPPEGAVETALAEVWAEVLGVDAVGRTDDFFALGGDSILSLRVLSRARERGVEISLEQIFGHPTVAQLARQAGGAESGPLTPEMAPFALVAEADRARLPAGVEDAYPLAQLQAGMLFHSELDPESAVYHDISSNHLQGPYDAALLRRAVEQVTRLHPLLRTSFHLTGFSEPLQIVHRKTGVDFEVEDWRSLSPAAQEEALAAWMEAEKARPVGFRRAPLLRFRVMRRGEDTFQLILSFHHVILDGWSLFTLQADLFRVYLALVQGREPDETPPPLAFRRFVALERETLASAASRDYWSRQLAGLEVTRLPRRGPVADAEGGSGVHLIGWPAELSARLTAAARPLGVPLKSTLLAAHARVLSALAGRSDVVTGLVTNGRPEEDGSDRALGLFLNTLPLRLDAAGGTWNDLMRAAFAAEREQLPHRRYPVADLHRQAGRTLFEPVFNFVHFHVHQGLAQHQEIRSLGGELFDRTNFTFLANFSLDPFTSQLQLRIDYDPDAFPAAQVAAVAGYYDRALAALAADPAGRYETRPLLSDAERTQVLAGWNDSARAIALPPCIHQIFEVQADLTPEAPALEMDGEVWSYRELGERADRLAALLQHRGVAVDDPVGICLERSLALPVAVLAALKAGGAYLPLDPAYPPDRLAVMVEEAGLKVVLAGRSALERLPEGWLPAGTRVIALDPQGEALDTAGLPPGRLAAGATADSLGYVLYTSGSTGRPKGVAMPHGALVNLIGWQLGGPRTERGLRTLQFTSLGFDPSFEEMFSTWGSGGILVLITEEERRDPNVLLDFLIERRIGRVFQPFVALQQLAEAARARQVFPSGLRDLVTAGEQLQITPAVVELFRRLPDCRLFNQYGPTETHVTTAALLTGAPEGWPTLPSIGGPIANHRVYLLDPHGEPVPPDAPGELFVGGAGLARGYLRRPDLTAERLVPDPFAGKPGARLYRTGDLARHLPDGEIEFLGRADRQVKIRGYRVEPGEIEAVLAGHPAVREAAVVPHGEGGGRRLAAYVVLHAGQEASSDDLRAHLGQRLPDYMVPWTFVRLDAMPLTPSGKVDRRALPAPEPERSRPERAYVPPHTPTEETIAAILSRILGVEPVGLRDSFLQLGGHSLLATQVMAHVNEAFGTTLPLRRLYECPDVEALATAVVQARAEQEDQELLARLLQQIEGEAGTGEPIASEVAGD
jgi:amino acid adenylation domain-containing protein